MLSHKAAPVSVIQLLPQILKKVCGFFHAQIQKGGDAMYFTSGQDRAFERLMQEKPSFDHYDGGGANAPEDCGSCRFYRPDWKYQYCVYAECPYQPGKLTALAAVKFTVKGADDDMAVFRVEKNSGYTVMSNHHLRNRALSLKAKGLLSQMLSLPEDWDYTLQGLARINRESIDAITARRSGNWNSAGYIQAFAENGTRKDGMARCRLCDLTSCRSLFAAVGIRKPDVGKSNVGESRRQENPTLENPMQLNKEIQRTNLPRKDKLDTEGQSTDSIPIPFPKPLAFVTRTRQRLHRRNGQEAGKETAVSNLPGNPDFGEHRV